jgi:transcriptional regulator with GAF, ATPase, and Fis domain
MGYAGPMEPLLLDEIAELAPLLQVNSTGLQEYEFYPRRATDQVDFRLITATNQDL